MVDRIKKPNKKKNYDDEDFEGDEDLPSDRCKGRQFGDDDGGDGSSSSSNGNSNARKKKNVDEDCKFYSRLLKLPKPYDGIDLTYFQFWFEMFKSEMMNKWEPWGRI